MIEKLVLLSFLFVVILISGCTYPSSTAEVIVQENSEKIQEDLQAYELEMDSNELIREFESYWEVAVYDPYRGKQTRPITYCIVKAYVNKNSKEVDYLHFGILCPDPETENKCKNFDCVSLKTYSKTEEEYQEITGQACDAENPCPEDLECFSFPDIGLRCADPNPCSYFDCPPWAQCVIAESYPGQVMCTS